VRASANELQLVPGHRWAERIDEGIARGLVQGLQSRVPNAIVLPTQGGMGSGAPVVVEVAIVACEGSPEGAILEAFWRLDRGGDDGPGSSGHFRRVSSAWDGVDFGALAAQLSELVDQLAAEIAAGIEP
jgi:uncharacterized lipoprotein YmbA